jgi:hypothetical protein
MATAFVQARHSTATTPDQSLAFTDPVVAGNLLVLGMREGATPPGNPTVTDSLGNTWTLAQAFANQFVYYTKTASSGACTVTVNSQGTVSTRMMILEFSGTFGTAPFHTAAAGVQVNGGTVTSNAVTPSAASGVMVALCANDNTADSVFSLVSGGYTLGPAAATGGTNGRVIPAYLTFSSAASYSVTISGTNFGNVLRIQNIAFVESGGGGGSAIAAISSGYHVRNINR